MKRLEVEVIKDDDARSAVMRGAKLLHDAVSVTMGPKGQNVLFKKIERKAGVTHDGVTVANLVESNEPREQVGLEIIREAALKQDSVVGDGTTTVTVLAYALLDAAHKLSQEKGLNPMQIRRELDARLPEVIEALERLVDKEMTEEKLVQVATVASGDKVIGEMVGKEMFKSGGNTPILLNFSDSTETYAETINGFKLDGGPASPYLLEGVKDEISDVGIFVIDAKLRQRDDVLPLLRTFAEVPQQDRNFLILCRDIAGDALSYLVTNKVKGFANLAVSRVPSEIKDPSTYLKDIAVMVGATVIAPNTAHNLREPSLKYAGAADKVVVSQLETVVVGGKGIQEDVDTYKNTLEKELKDAKTKAERKHYEDRLLQLRQAIVSFYVGGQSESDAEERHYRFEDAVGASKTALRSGIVPGGGTALYFVASNLRGTEVSSQIFNYALAQPAMTILKNAGIEYSTSELSLNKGYDVLHPEKGVIDLKKAGIVDPAESEIEAVRTATAIAGLLLTAGAVIVDKVVGDEA